MGLLSKKKASATTETNTPKDVAKAPAPSPKSQTLADMPLILEALGSENDKSRKLACKSVYELSDVGHKRNRVTMVKSHYSVVPALLKVVSTSTGDCRHLALLSLNNLSIPLENKKSLTADGELEKLLPVMLDVMKSDSTEAYLAAICLMNLSFLESSVAKFVTAPGFLKTIETFISSNKAGGEGVRWTCGLIKNLSRKPDAARAILGTKIPPLLLALLKATSANSSRWANNSLEDFASFVVLHLAQHAGDKDQEKMKGIVDVMRPVAMSAVGIQSLKAKIILGLSPASTARDFPPSAGSDLVEVLGRVLAKQGKDKVFSPGVFKLSTIVKSLNGLASRGDVSTITTPTAAAYLLQIVASYTLASRETKLEDVTPAVLSAATFQAMLDLLLVADKKGGEESAENVKAIAEVSSLFFAFKEFSTDEETCDDVVETLKKAAGIERLMLVRTAALWGAQRERDGILTTFFNAQEQGQEVDTSGPLDFLQCNTESGCIIL